ncbi:MAG: methionine--tRNA ligase [bacterium]
MKTNKILVTSALPYANGPIHLGHLVEYIQTDIYVRYLRMIGRDVLYCCGDDAHGTPIEINARQQGISPEELIEKYYKEHLLDFNEFQISFDSYYTTNSPENKTFSDLVFSRLYDRGDIYKKPVNQTYCPNCKRFLPDRYVKGICPKCNAPDQYGDNCEVCNSTYKTTDLIDPYCSLCSTTPIVKKSIHYFFRLSAYSEKLADWIHNSPLFQSEVKNYILSWIDTGLNDWDISRDAPYFGFKIKGEEDKYYYVWMDAPIGYIASTKHFCDKHGLDFDSYWTRSEECNLIHVIGKDIIYFHFLFWPAMLMGSGFNLPENIFVHGFLTINKKKMSKSRGTFITARQYLEKYDPSLLRFYFAYNISGNISDIDLDCMDLKDKVNSEIIGNFGNLVYRTLTFLYKHFQGRIHTFNEEQLTTLLTEKRDLIGTHYSMCNFREVLKIIFELGDIGNKYFQQAEPWKRIKTAPDIAWSQISFCVHLIHDLCIYLKPILPAICKNLEYQLQVSDLKWSDLGTSLAGITIKKPEPLLKKIESFELIT